MLLLCRIDIAEAGKPYQKNIRQIPHFINQHDSFRPPCKCHVTQKSRNSSVLTITKGKKKFRRENLSQYQFLAALIFHKSKNSEGLTILQFEFFNDVICSKCHRLHWIQVTFNEQEKIGQTVSVGQLIIQLANSLLY